jgi:hypothetical protein
MILASSDRSPRYPRRLSRKRDVPENGCDRVTKPGREDRCLTRPMALRLHICQLNRHRPCGADRLVVHDEQRRAFMRQPHSCPAVMRVSPLRMLHPNVSADTVATPIRPDRPPPRALADVVEELTDDGAVSGVVLGIALAYPFLDPRVAIRGGANRHVAGKSRVLADIHISERRPSLDTSCLTDKITAGTAK